MGFTGKKAAKWREFYIKAFNDMEREIHRRIHDRERQLTLDWKEARENGKIAHRIATDAIQEFCEFAKGQGSKNYKFYYKALTERIYDAIIIPGGNKEIIERKKLLKKDNGRDTLSLDEIIKIELMEKLVLAKVIKEIKGNNGPYKDLYPILKEKILQYGLIINNQPILPNLT